MKILVLILFALGIVFLIFAFFGHYTAYAPSAVWLCLAAAIISHQRNKNQDNK